MNRNIKRFIVYALAITLLLAGLNLPHNLPSKNNYERMCILEYIEESY